MGTIPAGPRRACNDARVTLKRLGFRVRQQPVGLAGAVARAAHIEQPDVGRSQQAHRKSDRLLCAGESATALCTRDQSNTAAKGQVGPEPVEHRRNAIS